MKITPIIRKSGRHWVIDRGPNKAMPCCNTKAEAERLLALSEKWEKKSCYVYVNGKQILAKVVNTAIVYGKTGLVDMLAVRFDNTTYWWPADAVEEEIK